MRDLIRFFVGLSLLILIACSGCGVENSQAEMSAAQEAMNEAMSYRAEQLAASNWNDAMQAWERGQAAVKAGKPSKTHFLQAKSRFAKTAAIAKAYQDRLSQEVSEMQRMINERFGNVRTALDSGRLASRIQTQVRSISAEIEAGIESIDRAIEQGDYLSAREKAKDTQTKVFNAELIMAGKRSVS